jgi:hypothetical protein
MLLWYSGTLSKIPDTYHCQGEQKFDSQQEDVPWRILFVALRRLTVCDALSPAISPPF